jgi:hypothetical protein
MNADRIEELKKLIVELGELCSRQNKAVPNR